MVPGFRIKSNNRNARLVKRLRYHPFTVETGVRFSHRAFGQISQLRSYKRNRWFIGTWLRRRRPKVWCSLNLVKNSRRGRWWRIAETKVEVVEMVLHSISRLCVKAEVGETPNQLMTDGNENIWYENIPNHPPNKQFLLKVGIEWKFHNIIGHSPSGKAQDFDSCTSPVQIRHAQFVRASNASACYLMLYSLFNLYIVKRRWKNHRLNLTCYWVK